MSAVELKGSVHLAEHRLGGLGVRRSGEAIVAARGEARQLDPYSADLELRTDRRERVERVREPRGGVIVAPLV